VDDIAAMKVGNEFHVLLPAFEVNRLKHESNATSIIAIEALGLDSGCGESDMIAAFLRRVTKEKTITVHKKFPFGLASKLIAMGFKIIADDGQILSERLVKSEWEISCIKKIIALADMGLAHGREILRLSSIAERGILMFKGSKLTSEFLREEIEKFCYLNGGLAEGTIVACGDQAIDPHCQGYGPLYANQLIVIDLFPLGRTSGYYADITRTFVRGNPTKAQVEMYETVKISQELAHKKLKNGASCSKLTREVSEYFESKGYKTDRKAKVPYGILHSLGHGFGLEIHEAPHISNNSNVLKTGNIITLEPGLYYPEIGGVRLEDDFLIADDGVMKLSDEIPYDWIIN
jgi:Xaa-Pro aminopeptidase